MNQESRQPGERLQAAAARARSGASERIDKIAGSLMIRAVLVGLVGLLILFWPAASLRLLVVAVAVLLVIDGIAGIVGMFRADERGAFLGQSLFSLLVGGALLLLPEPSTRALMLLLGVWALVHGAMLMWALRGVPAEAPYRSTQQIVAAIMAILGIVLLAWPNVGLVALSWMVGIAALIVAGVLFWLSRKMKGVGERIAGPG